jgi:DNA invertase Pin-like site-specific DNA recombinase
VLQNSSRILCCRNDAFFLICNMRIGYARVSTDDQTLDLQRDALARAKCRQIYAEHASGKSAARPQLDACLKALREGDTLIVWRLDRLGRSLADLIRLTNDLKSRSIELESLTENLETGSPTGKLVFHVFAALAEFERNLIRERTLAGLKAARARGRKGGRPKKLQAKELKTVRALLKTGKISVQELARRFGVSRSTLYRNAEPVK